MDTLPAAADILAPASKKQRPDCEDRIEITDVKANEFIKLIFVDTFHDQSTDSLPESSQLNNYYSTPTYTHQLFEEERINFLSETTRAAFIKNYQLSCSNDKSYIQTESQPALLIYIKCSDLTHYAATRSIYDLGDREMLMAKIQTALPRNSISQKATEIDDKLSSYCQYCNSVQGTTPPGNLLATFESAIDSSSTLTPTSSCFEIFLATAKDNAASELLQRAEKIAMWYIETADSVDFSDERWEVLFLYHIKIVCGNNDTLQDFSDTDQGPTISNFAGYMTLFTFHNPILGSKIRVCQALVLPHMQGRSLGRKMLLTVYELAQSRSNIVEVTVEDPAPAFERLRDMVDCEWVLLYLYKHKSNHEQSDLIEKEDIEEMKIRTNFIGDNNNDDLGITKINQTCQGLISLDFRTLDVMKLKKTILDSGIAVTSTEEKERQKHLKLTSAQTFFAFEALQYSVLIFSIIIQDEKERRISGLSEDSEITISSYQKEELLSKIDCAMLSLSSSSEYRAFRLRVKRRILNANKHLKGPNMQRDLEELYEEHRIRYNHCLQPISRIRVY